MAASDDMLARLVEATEEQLRWTRAAVLPEVRRTIEGALPTTQLRRAYERCDGETQSNEVATAVGVSKSTFSGWTRRWRDLGIAYEVDGRLIKHLTSLRSLGLDIEIDGRSDR
jgi:hypothetical protein